MIRPPPSSPLFPYPPLFRSLLFNPRAAIQKWRQQLIHACLELLRRLRAEAEKVPQNCAKNQQRDNICAAHRDCGLRTADRSEEHTSELQSQSNLVCRLLLEK